MSRDDREADGVKKDVDAGSRGRRDRVAYVGIGIYSFIQLGWVLWALSGAGFGIFDTAILVGMVLPGCGIATLAGFQLASRRNRFSGLANVLSVLIVFVWLLVVWSIVLAASAAV